ncbi:TPA: hypothetical protein JZG38_004876 [Escherichia coli]|nr:hypothetical protein [Escherichia coli]HAX5121019.1 hypothetical protein [Escherichia coli]HAX5131158.1 hypothetical protein [Escherichia coli]HAX5182069.1 hypothetical protein [Escherichia coli]HAX5279381.1 hypothetical protein [Escherichia coli]
MSRNRTVEKNHISGTPRKHGSSTGIMLFSPQPGNYPVQRLSTSPEEEKEKTPFPTSRPLDP